MKYYSITQGERGKAVSKGAQNCLRTDIYFTSRTQPNARITIGDHKDGAVLIVEEYFFGKWTEKYKNIYFTNQESVNIKL